MASEKTEFHAKLRARVIIDMLGAPKEHIEKTMKEYVQSLKSDKDIRIVSEDIAPATEQKKLFSTFAELEIMFKDVQRLIDFCFDAMPSSVDIIEPEKIEINSANLSSTLNDLQARMHRNDMIIKTLRAKQALLDKNAKAVVHNFVHFVVRDEPQTAEHIAKCMGLKPEHMKPFLNELVEERKIVEKGGRYGRAK